jgi:hypothetical protein
MIWEEMLEEIKQSLRIPKDGKRWTDSELLWKANVVQEEICRRALCIRKEAILKKDDYGDLYKKPTNCIRIKEIRYKGRRLKGTTKTELDKMAELGKIKASWEEEIGEPIYYFQEFREIGLYPRLENASENPVIEYYSLAEDMVDETDEAFNGIDFLQVGSQTIIDGVCYKCLLEDQNNIYVEYKERFNMGIRELVEQFKEPDALESFR